MSTATTKEIELVKPAEEIKPVTPVEENPNALVRKAAVAPSTVEKIGNGKQTLPKAKKRSSRRRSSRTRAKSSLVKHIIPREDVREKALELARGNEKLLLTVAEDVIVVMNHPKQFTSNQFK